LYIYSGIVIQSSGVIRIRFLVPNDL